MGWPNRLDMGTEENLPEQLGSCFIAEGFFEHIGGGAAVGQ